MSYAEAAASSGPIGAEKLPKPAEIETVTIPLGSVEVVDAEEFAKIKNPTEDTQDTDASSGAVAKDSEKLPFYESAIATLKETYAKALEYFVEKLPKEEGVVAKELKNPVVASQVAVAIGAVSAGWLGYLSTSKVQIDGKKSAVYVGVISALIVGDIYLFQKYYPKFKKQ